MAMVELTSCATLIRRAEPVKIYALYYYDRPMLPAFLSHYCQFKVIDEIIIQNQNWSREDSLFLLDTVAAYVDKYRKKIVVLPSRFRRGKGSDKRNQFRTYGIPAIQNRVTQFIRKNTWIWGAMDEVIYGQNYTDTEEQLRKFEVFAEERASHGESSPAATIGYLRHYCVYKDGFFPCEGIPTRRMARPVWRHRLFRFSVPFACRGVKVHDNSIDAFIGKKWRRVTPVACCTSEKAIGMWNYSFPTGLRLLHYHTLVRRSIDSAEFMPVYEKHLKNPKEHPFHYLRLLAR